MNLIFLSCIYTLPLLALDGPYWWPWRVWQRIFRHPLDVSMLLRCGGQTLMVSSGIQTTCPWDDLNDQAFLGLHRIVGQDAIGFWMLGGHEFSDLDLKERLRLLMNKVPFFLHYECFPLNFGIFLFSSRLDLGGSMMIFCFLKMCITVDVVDLFSSKIVLG